MIISFDMDGTLMDKNFDDLLWFNEMPKLYANKNDISFENAKKICIKEYNSLGNKDIRWYDVKHWLDHFGLKKDFRSLMENLKEHIILYPETKDVLKELSQTNKLIIISTASREFIDIKTEVDQISNYFDRTFSVTSDFKANKKEENVYKQVCKILKIKPEEMIHIGDNYKSDFQIPQKIGLKSYYLDRKGEHKGRYVVKNLKEFKEKIN